MGKGIYDEELYLFFRRSCLSLQRQFVERLDVSRMPRVFLHGNPHVDNFAKTEFGEAMIDFDRSRHGPYAWDLVRFMSSLALRQAEPDSKFLHKNVVSALSEGYQEGFEKPDSVSKAAPELLSHERPAPHETSMRAYLAANHRWAKKMRKNPIFTSHPTVRSLIQLYFRGRNEPDFESRFTIEEAGIASGTLGKPRVLVVLAPKDLKSDKILLDIKEVYEDPDTEYFFNPYVHHGLRMIEASYLHAPGFEQRLGFLTWRDRQYWARRVPCFKAKLKGALPPSKQRDLALSVGLQLGRAHRRSLRETKPKELLRHLKDSLADFLSASKKLNKELIQSWNQQRELDKKSKSSKQESHREMPLSR
ncbi:MAG: DUF2252 family protein [Bdellovibrionota bacterium]